MERGCRVPETVSTGQVLRYLKCAPDPGLPSNYIPVKRFGSKEDFAPHATMPPESQEQRR